MLSRISSVKLLALEFSIFFLISSTPESFAIELILVLNSLDIFLILPHQRPRVLNTAGRSLGPTKMIINAAITKYSTPPIPGNMILAEFTLC